MAPNSNDPAAELQARFQARADEKLKRDSKLREEWLGREYELSLDHELFHVERLRVRLIGYDPRDETVFMRPLWVIDAPVVPWSTDSFWSMLESGQLKEV